MGIELERKFLIDKEKFNLALPSLNATEYGIKQGYLSVDPARTVRVRIVHCANDVSAYITIKGMSTADGLSRKEWEYSIDPKDAEEMIAIAIGVIIKRRIVVGRFEVDFFCQYTHPGVAAIAEIELDNPHEEICNLPDWIVKEVTGDPRYYNSNLINK